MSHSNLSILRKCFILIFLLLVSLAAVKSTCQQINNYSCLICNTDNDICSSCAFGYNVDNGSCSHCSIGSNCSSCPGDHKVWGENNLCACVLGYHLLNGTCLVCSEGLACSSCTIGYPCPNACKNQNMVWGVNNICVGV